ncbi:MBL fold metallo-hydrolase [Cognatilysobacter tabacisoli]|uniref:MBL fold metallo-hydrolase n=1 Tax=Cognatilysobacter tabacisoli TaxID=2315424 RepID=UPI000E6B06DF|nr:MBL fold metallo-hydrolase [Lysobacter tabacisoli]
MRLARCIALALALVAAPAAAQDFSKVQIKANALRGGTHVLTGAGGNIVASVGSDGAYIIDDQYAPLSEKILAALKAIGDQPLRFVINTHWHGDHTGGNEAMGKAGAVIMAHDNVRKRMGTAGTFRGEAREAAPAGALPVVTFKDGVSLHLNGDHVHARHVARAHTDGDSLVKFENANVLHMGDVYFNGLYPFIDLESGGSIDGFLAAIRAGVEMSDADTLVVPGHGPVSNRAELAAYGDMLQGYRDAIAAMKRDGKTLQQVIAAKPTAATDEKLGKAFIKPDQLVTSIYNSL